MLVLMLDSVFLKLGRVVGGSRRGWCWFCGVVAVLLLREVEAGLLGLHPAAKNEKLVVGPKG